MNKGYPPVWLCATLLGLALLWRMLGAPLTAEQFSNIQTPLWQARILWPSRVVRMLKLWMPEAAHSQPETLREEAIGPDGQALEQLASAGEPMNLNVYLSAENRCVTMDLESYVCGVVAAEMPAAYHLEALKAQAVAARTRALWQKANGGCAMHPGADICTDSGHCQGYDSLAKCQQRWGEEYSLYRDRIVSAAQATRDELLTYKGEPITVMYHAISGGKTEDAQTVFNESRPYLVSVDSYGEESAKGFAQDASFTFEEVAQKLKDSLDMDFSADQVRKTLAINDYTSTGRVESMLIDGQRIAATAFRSALGLRSTWFSMTMDDTKVTFHQRGYGHGVGMSQVGANSMAADGVDYIHILTHYYPGVSLEKR